MKKVLILIPLFALLFVGCGSDNSSISSANTETAPAAAQTNTVGKDEASLRPVAQEELDALSAGSFGEAWDLRTDEAKALMSREDYIRLNQECPKLSNFQFQIQKITINGNQAEVRVTVAGFNASYDFVYENGQWRYDPPADVKADYKLGADQLLAKEKAAGNCS